MQITFTRRASMDRMHIARAPGDDLYTEFHHKGPFPHDLMHYCVERAFGFRFGFWGLIAQGMTPQAVQDFAAARGHASAAKAHPPATEIVELLQAERLVECFEAELWGGPAELGDLQSVADAAFSASLVPRVALAAETVQRLRAEISGLNARWQALKPGETLRVEWA
jgi:hypothetical protein